ncbi:peptidase domain-containing ABC transporter [Citrobacter sp.]|uniref:peptidase domain-containing ABC transporter n=1 Tax=Citrobacter sp. TaxID=1896336 RepID=UPI00290041B3|nr:cysteine peptidase family C39 domain-containing protein [Citrobacter sp.]MDU1876534.1 cysteine peptidase family C39 domain-containing protein [Citrobacter sp.]
MRNTIPEMVMQNEASECGLACISMLADYYGIEASLEKLRLKYPTSLHGFTLARLSTILNEMGLPGVPVQFDYDELNALPLPAILHYGAGHYVVLAWRSGNNVCVLNPSLGKQLLTFDALKREISGFALIIDEQDKRILPEGAKAKRSKGWLPSWLSVKATSNVPYIYILMITTFVISMAVFIIPVMMSSSLNALYSQQQVEVSWWLYIIAFIGIAGIDLLNGIFSANVVKRFSHISNTSGFRRLIHQPLRYFQKRNAGDIYSRFSHWCGALRGKIALDNTLRIDWLIALLSFGVMFWINSVLSLVSLFSITLIGLISLWAAWKDRIYTQKIELLSAEQNDFIMETVSGIHTIKSAGLHEYRQIAFAEQNKRMVQALRNYAVYNKIKSNLYQLTSNGETILYIAISLPLLQSGEMHFGTFVSYGLIKQIYGNYMSKLFFTVLQKNEIGVIDKRAQDFLFSEDASTDSTDTTEHFQRSIRFDNLRFAWTPECNVINGLTLTLRKGECVAIIGESGEGKTTFLSIAAGLLMADSGEIAIDDVVQSPGQWASMAFMNSTDHILLQGSVRDNITLFRSDYTINEDRQIRHILDALGIADVIDHLPGGLNARIREGNSGLSAGQHQRLLLARALYCNHELVILDEPTANLDVAAAQQTMTAIVEHCRQHNKTLITVTHNPALLGAFDAVYQFSHGRLSREGYAHEQ